tara:strand:+ start:917 stop:1192 length:276 start_codon:yes stop_codon:yes gene_type:complete
MNQNFMKSIVIILGVLIILAFIAIIYGTFLKLDNKTNNFHEFNLNLENNEKIEDFKIINENNILIIINNGYEKKALIYSLKKNKITKNINR